MMKEDRKPLRYITSGIIAMNFFWRKNRTNDHGRSMMEKKKSIYQLYRMILFYLRQPESVD